MTTMLHSSGSSLIFKASLLSFPDPFDVRGADQFYYGDREAGLRVGPELMSAPVPAPASAPWRDGCHVPRKSSLLEANTCKSSTAFKLDSYLDFLTDHS